MSWGVSWCDWYTLNALLIVVDKTHLECLHFKISIFQARRWVVVVSFLTLSTGHSDRLLSSVSLVFVDSSLLVAKYLLYSTRQYSLLSMRKTFLLQTKTTKIMAPWMLVKKSRTVGIKEELFSPSIVDTISKNQVIPIIGINFRHIFNLKNITKK